MADRQKARVYKWESEWCDFNRTTMTLKECREAVQWACKKYAVPPPRVTQHEGTQLSYSQGNVISFRKDQKNAAIALHEAAHYIAGIRLPPEAEDHGKEWMGLYLWLLEGYRVAPRTALHASARAKRIRWTQTWRVSPSRLARR